ncbi:hypothetical protein [Amycolatopsis jiangsuensis]|uniref:Secreted protein n=1 Tax=Amycolatopsis jiangsuensis TaxID=1181879 RepID=A0A840INH5_9PSEU|nr:hypothetical protein [Amycolatopsis jiangsuensis]MBB4682758.1 hypothetical protein [Amycolatopsis jiangsuensis]
MDARRLALFVSATAVLVAGAGGSVALAQTHQQLTAEPGRNVVLGQGQEAWLAGRDFTVRYAGLVSDSRCPPQLQCFAPGDAVVTVALAEPGQGERTSVQLHTGRPGPRETTYSATAVRLVDVSPAGDRITLRLTE